MKTEETKHVNILSYYSEDKDYYDRTDGVYSIYYPVDMDIRKEIRRAYDELTEEEQPTGQLSFMLDYLIAEGKQIDYECLSLQMFDCDYGMFAE